jgi:hypothetical protein
MDAGAGARKIQLPNPALCLDRVFEISNISSTNTLAVYQYNATAFGGAVIPLPGVAGGTLQTGTSVAVSAGTTPAITTASGTPKYTSARYFCDGTTWLLLSATPNPIY